MRVFIGSVIRDFAEQREAAAHAASDLGHEVLRAESLGARDATPEQACLQLERSADAAVVLLGERYGPIQRSGLSATHEEYRDARERIPVLVFVQDGVVPEDAERAFIAEARDWAGGRFAGTFTTAATLRQSVTRALHELELARAVGPAEPTEITERAQRAAAVPAGGQHPILVVAIASGPAQQLVRPAQLEDQAFRDALLRSASFGPAPIFDPRAATTERLQASVLALEQTRSQVRLDGLGTVTVVDPRPRAAPPAGLFGGLVVIEEDVREGILVALRFTGALLDEIDPTHRVSVVAPVAALLNLAHTDWRTRAEHAANPNTMHPNMFGPERAVVELIPSTRPRAALIHQATQIAEDLVVLLRREARDRA